MSNHQKVVDFQKRVLGNEERPLGLMNPSEFCLSLEQLREEIKEMEDAYDLGDIVGVVDGLVDLKFYLLGVVHKMGVSEDKFNRIFHVVYEKNMQKKLGTRPGHESYEGVPDAYKPEGWVGPEEQIRQILDN